MTAEQRRLAVALGAVTLAGFIIRIVGLGSHVATPEDISVVQAAVNYVRHGQLGPIALFQPPMRDLVTYAFIKVFGYGATGVLGASVVTGTLTIPLLGLLVWRLTRNVPAATIAASFLALDTLHIDFSRQAIQEVQTTFLFMLGTVLAVYVIAKPNDTRDSRWLLPLAGLAFGFGAASKGHALPPLLVSFMFLAWGAWRRKRWQDGVFAFVSLFGMAALAYLITYVPWFKGGYSFGEWLDYQGAAYVEMARHAKPAIGYLAYNKAWQWFVRPLVPYADPAVRPNGTFQVAMGVGNPLVWLAVLPAAVWSAVKKIRTSRTHQLLQAYFWVAYVPFVLASRPIWLLSANGITPFAYALLAVVLFDAAKQWGWKPVGVYLAACLVVALLLLPLGLGFAADVGYLAPILRSAGDMRMFL